VALPVQLLGIGDEARQFGECGPHGNAADLGESRKALDRALDASQRVVEEARSRDEHVLLLVERVEADDDAGQTVLDRLVDEAMKPVPVGCHDLLGVADVLGRGEDVQEVLAYGRLSAGVVHAADPDLVRGLEYLHELAQAGLGNNALRPCRQAVLAADVAARGEADAQVPGSASRRRTAIHRFHVASSSALGHPVVDRSSLSSGLFGRCSKACQACRSVNRTLMLHSEVATSMCRKPWRRQTSCARAAS
jgi:hypothetical protein